MEERVEGDGGLDVCLCVFMCVSASFCLVPLCFPRSVSVCYWGLDLILSVGQAISPV